MAGKLVVRGGTVIDGTGRAPIRDAAIVVEGDRITQVGAMKDFAPDALNGSATRVIDAKGKWVIPGMFNLHEHLDNHRGTNTFQARAAQPTEVLLIRAFRNALSSLIHGVTTVRDMGAKGDTNLYMRDAINSGQLLGPRVFACGQPISMTGGHGSEICVEADGVDGVRLAARKQLKLGADLIKVMASGGYVNQGRDQPWSPQLTKDEMRAAIDEAHNAGKPTGAHCHPARAIKAVIEAGVDTIEHGALMEKDSAELMEKQNVYLVPTLDESWMIAEHGEELGRPKWLVQACREKLDHRLEVFAYAISGKVKCGVGTDVAGEMGREMSHMIDAGMSNLDALVAATRHGAEVLRIQDQVGTLEDGKYADLVILDADPLVDILTVDSPRLVVKGGVVHDPEQLRAALGPTAS